MEGFHVLLKNFNYHSVVDVSDMFPGGAFRGELSGAHHAGENFGQAVRVTFHNVTYLKKKTHDFRSWC